MTNGGDAAEQVVRLMKLHSKNLWIIWAVPELVTSL